MTPARFKTAVVLAMFLGFGFLTIRYVSSRLNPVYSLTGTVSLDGKPLAQGVVRFVSLDPVDTVWALDGVVKDGRFEIPEGYGLAPARYQVEFSGIGPDELRRIDDAMNRGESIEFKDEVPPRFNRESEIRIDLRSGAVVHADFELN